MKDLSQENIQSLLNLIAQSIKDGKDSVTVSIATLQDLGIVKPDGTTITINNGVISANLPTINIATASAVGIAKPDDDTLTIDSSGTISLNTVDYSSSELVQKWNQAKNGGGES